MLEENAQRMLDETKKAVSADIESNRTRGPPKIVKAENFSIEYDANNRPYVVVENDLLDGVPQKDWVRTIKDNLRKKFPNGVTVGKNIIAINKKSIREMTYSRYTQRLMETNPELYADKLKATYNADEILKASRNYVNEALMHPRKDKIQDFARGEVLLRIGNSDYSAQVIVAMHSNGKLLMYDILYLESTDLQEKIRSPTRR